MSKVEIDFRDMGRTCVVKVDGKDVPHIARLTLDLSAGDLPQLSIEQIVTDGHISVEECDTTIEPRVVTTAWRSA